MLAVIFGGLGLGAYLFGRVADRMLAAHPVCQSLGCGQASTEVDHIVPRRQGGTDAWDNLQAL
ncbi:MAG: HNH endonuclease, partial [Planctomycetota bacterium]